MDLRTLIAAGAALLLSAGALGANDSNPPPEQGQPDTTQQVPPDPYADINKQVQGKLQDLGFYSGPVNGDFGFNTQAALAQFQLSVPLPASGMLDGQTLEALGVAPEAPAQNPSAGASAAAEPPTAELDRKLGGSCDALVGPDKDRCLQQGGTVEASAK
jgi:peptidoglycan hydrolase-like protein with peptidoglycan-binding domain